MAYGMPPVCKTGALRRASSILVYSSMEDMFYLQVLHPEIHFNLFNHNVFIARRNMLVMDTLRGALCTPEQIIYEEIYNARYEDLYRIVSEDLREDIQKHTKELIQEETYNRVYQKLYSLILKAVIHCAV